MSEQASIIWRDVISLLNSMPPTVNWNAKSVMHARLEFVLLRLQSDRTPVLPRAAWERLIVVEQVRDVAIRKC
jgi:hypothetical protein